MHGAGGRRDFTPPHERTHAPQRSEARGQSFLHHHLQLDDVELVNQLFGRGSNGVSIRRQSELSRRLCNVENGAGREDNFFWPQRNLYQLSPERRDSTRKELRSFFPERDFSNWLSSLGRRVRVG